LPTITLESGYRIFFYSNELNKPPHAHIRYQGREAKFWINPTRLAQNYGMNTTELSRASFIVKKHEKLILEKWNVFFGKKI
jgi:hypothetical protein